MTKNYKRFLAYMLKTKQFQFVYVNKKIRIFYKYSEQVLQRDDVDFLYLIWSKKTKAAIKRPLLDNKIKPLI
jgi:hypothetical protein